MLTFPLSTAAMLALLRWRRQVYVRYREAFCLALALHVCWAALEGGAPGRRGAYVRWWEL